MPKPRKSGGSAPSNPFTFVAGHRNEVARRTDARPLLGRTVLGAPGPVTFHGRRTTVRPHNRCRSRHRPAAGRRRGHHWQAATRPPYLPPRRYLPASSPAANTLIAASCTLGRARGPARPRDLTELLSLQLTNLATQAWWVTVRGRCGGFRCRDRDPLARVRTPRRQVSSSWQPRPAAAVRAGAGYWPGRCTSGRPPPRSLCTAPEHVRHVAEHEPLALGVAQHPAVTAHRLGDQQPGHRQRPDHVGGVELHELHVQQGRPGRAEAPGGQ